jgi:hypothetical protein
MNDAARAATFKILGSCGVVADSRITAPLKLTGDQVLIGAVLMAIFDLTSLRLFRRIALRLEGQSYPAVDREQELGDAELALVDGKRSPAL